MTGYLYAAALLHVLFMLCELFPWQLPILLRIVSKGLPQGEGWKPQQREVVATIVHNAGIYNAIVAGGLCFAAWRGEPARDVAQVMLAGAVLAGAFGTVTLKSWLTGVQAIVGLVGLVLLAI